ncbi:hypothetical protein [Nocardioides dongxiaopingii]|uniref:hypothetical protein n=1 Tax=Nocardioides dongxiaopingii TaxID=2576036 RepID=UPI0010C76F8E|nr:hypothetical protein [Nocardioides dongxiaopingii]
MPAPPRLRPGVHVVVRDADHVQLGLDPPARVIVARRPEVARVLERLTAGLPPAPTTPEGAAVIRDLAAAGLLVVPETPPTGSVRLVSRGLDLAPLGVLLEDAGLTVTRSDPLPDLYVVATPGPLPRAVVDGWVGEGAPHLVVAGTSRPGGLRVGPLVEPGTTACLRCVDAHEATHDPRRPLLVEQLAALPAAPVDRRVVALATAWAARDAVDFLAGRRPVTWSGTVDLDGPSPVVRTWDRHPHCGCGWDDVPY